MAPFELISAYDEENRLTTLTQGTNITRYTYDKNGNVLVKTLPNGDTATSVYDAANRTTSLTGVSGTSVSLYAYAYEYDAAANVKRVGETYSNTALNRVVTNAYDNNNRLIQEAVTGSAAGTTDFTYDDANNRESMSKGGVLTTYSLNNLNQLTGFVEGLRVVSFSYDENGNRNQRTEGAITNSYTYDYENRLRFSERLPWADTGLNIFNYGYRTRRISHFKMVGLPTATRFVFSGGTSVREFENDIHTVDYVRGSDWGGGVGGILYSLRGGVPSFTHYNRRGDVTAKTSAAGAITYQSQYEAYGKRTVETGETLDRQKSNTKDEDIPGYAHEGFRFRDLETGSFISRDPAGFVDGPNLYAYVVQNPWTSFDPLGLQLLRHQEVGVGGIFGYPANFSGQAKGLGMDYNKQSNPNFKDMSKGISSSGSSDIIVYNGHGGIVNGQPSVAAAGKAPAGEISVSYSAPGLMGPTKTKGTAYSLDQMAQDISSASGVPSMVMIGGCELTASDMRAVTDVGVSVAIASGGEGEAAFAGSQMQSILDTLANGGTVNDALAAANTIVQSENDSVGALMSGSNKSEYTASYGQGLSGDSTYQDIQQHNQKVNENRSESVKEAPITENKE